jgi:hypothetical protein
MRLTKESSREISIDGPSLIKGWTQPQHAYTPESLEHLCRSVQMTKNVARNNQVKGSVASHLAIFGSATHEIFVAEVLPQAQSLFDHRD